jgi:hypothetical protein
MHGDAAEAGRRVQPCSPRAVLRVALLLLLVLARPQEPREDTDVSAIEYGG